MAGLTVTRVAHSTALLDFSGHVILTDPWFSEKPGYYRGEPLGIPLGDLPHLEGVAVTHRHYDHYDMDAFRAYRDKAVPFAVKTGSAEPANQAGFSNVQEMDPWDTFSLGSVRVTATPGKHAVPENTYVLQAGRFTVFFGGDSLLVPEVRDVARRFPHIDVALLPINGLAIRPMFNRKIVMDAQDAAGLCAILKPEIAIPIHYRYQAGPWRERLLLKLERDPRGFERAAGERAPETTVHVLPPGEPLDVGP